MARKNKGLPFVVQPRLEPIIERVGTEDSGVIEIRRQGYLSVAEKSMVDQASADLSDQDELIGAVKQIAAAEGLTISKVFDMLQDSEDSAPLLEKYAAEIAMASSSGQTQVRKVKIIAATALIMSRIDTDWTVEETMELHPDLLEGLYSLYQDEDMRSLAAFEAGSEKKDSAAKK